MKKVLLLILTIFPLALGYSQAMEIDIDTAIKLVKENNIDLKRAALNLNGKKSDMHSSANVFFPKVEGFAAYSRANEGAGTVIPEPISNPHISFETPADTLALGYSASFTFTPALFDAITLLKKDYELGEITYEQTVSMTEKSVKIIFYNSILIRERISLLEDNLSTLQARYELTKTNYEAGLVSELDLLQVQVSLENFKPTISKVKKGYKSMLLNFKNLMGIDLDQEIEIIGEIDPDIEKLDFEEVYSQAIANSKTLKILNKTEEVLLAQKKSLFNRDFLPVLSFEFSQSTGLGDPLDSANWKEDNFADDQGSFKVSAFYSFHNLFPMSNARVQQDKVERQIEDLSFQKDSALNNLKMQIIDHLETLNTSKTTQKGLELNVELSRKSLEKVEQAYKAGTKQILEVEDSEDQYNQARLNLLEEKFNYLNTWLELNSIISAE